MFIKRVQQFLIMAVIAGQLCCQGWYFPGVDIFPAYLLCLVALTLLSICVLVSQNRGMIAVKSGFGPLAVLLIINIGLVLLISGKFDIQRFMLITCSFAFCLGCTQAFCTEDEIKVLLKWYVFVVLISAIVEIGQVFEISFCTELWEKLHVSSDKITQATEDKRYLGLASDSLQFSYHVTAAFIIVLFMKFKHFSLLKKCVLFVLFGFALFTNATRSGLIALFVVVIIRLFTTTGKLNKIQRVLRLSVSVVALGMLFVFVFGSSFISDTRFSDIDGGAEARLPMILTAFNHALHYPFGMGVYSVQPDLIVGSSYATRSLVISNTAHNLFGNCGASYGFIGLVLMLGLYIWAYNTYRKKKKLTEDPTIYVIAFCALLGLVINASFHNAYILNGELSSFVFFAIMHTECKKGNMKTSRIGDCN